MGQFYYKIRQLLQNVTVITKCDVYYKMRRHRRDQSRCASQIKCLQKIKKIYIFIDNQKIENNLT